MEFSKVFKSQAFVSGLACFLKPPAVQLKTLSFPTPTKNPFPVMSCSIRKEEINALKESLAEASFGNTFVVCTGETICNMGLEAEAFGLSYPLLKQLHKYDITNWKEELNIGWKRYDDCAINNETYFFKQLKYLQDMTRFYVARHPLLLQSRMHEQEYYNSFSHLLFVDEETSEFDYLKHVQNPKALKLTHAADIDHIISICKVLNPKQERGKMLIIIKLSPPLLHDLDAYIGKMKEEGIVVTWLLDPLVTVPKGHEVITWSLGKSLEKLRPICNILGRSGYNLGGFYMETTGDESECKLYHETIMKNQSRLDVELSLAALEELGLARFTIYRTGGGWLRMN